MTTTDQQIREEYRVAFDDYGTIQRKAAAATDVSKVLDYTRTLTKLKKALTERRKKNPERYERAIQLAIEDKQILPTATEFPDVETALNRPRRTRSSSRTRTPGDEQPAVATRTGSQGRQAKGARPEHPTRQVVDVDQAVPGQASTVEAEAVLTSVREAEDDAIGSLPAALEDPADDAEGSDAEGSDAEGSDELDDDELPLDRDLYPCDIRNFEGEANLEVLLKILLSHMEELMRLERGRASLQRKYEKSLDNLNRVIGEAKNAEEGAKETFNLAADDLRKANDKVKELRQKLGAAESAKATVEAKAREAAEKASKADERGRELVKNHQQEVSRLSSRISSLEQELAAAKENATRPAPTSVDSSGAVEAAVKPLQEEIDRLSRELAEARGASRMSLLARRRANLYPSAAAMRALADYEEFGAVEDQVRRVNRGYRSDLRDAHFTLHVILLFACPTLNEGFMKYVEDPAVLNDLFQEPMRRRDATVRSPGVGGEVHLRAYKDLRDELKNFKGAVYPVPTASSPEMVVLAELVIIYAQTVTGSNWTARQLRWIMFAGIQKYADLTTSEVVDGAKRELEVDYVTKILLDRPDMCALPTRELLTGQDYSCKDDFQAKLAAIKEGPRSHVDGNEPVTTKTTSREARSAGDAAPKRAHKESKGKRAEGRNPPLLMRHFHAHPNAKVREVTAPLDGAINVTVAAQGHCFLCGRGGHYCDECPIKGDRSKWIPLARDLEQTGRERCLVGALVAKGVITAV